MSQPNRVAIYSRVSTARQEAEGTSLQMQEAAQHGYEVVATLAADGLSQRGIAAAVGVDQKTVSNDLRRSAPRCRS
jgi:DNA invertase Pin-like site-specific DNA recombinase